MRTHHSRFYAAVCAMTMLAVAAGEVSAQATRPLLEGILGMPLSPGEDMWEPLRPTGLLERDRFVITMSGLAASPMTRDYAGGGDHGYSIGLNGGTIVAWDQGVTGIWALGSGQTQEWTDPDGLYRLSPSPKLGLMAISHAKRTRGGWELGGSVLRSSFSLNDTFFFDRFPTSDDSKQNRYLYDLLPEAIGDEIDYDAIGDKLELVLDVARPTRIGTFAVSGHYWDASLDWMTRHLNTISSTAYDQNYLSQRLYVVGDGSGDMDGYGGEGRWTYAVSSAGHLGVRYGRSAWSGHNGLRLSNPARFPASGGVGTRTVEPPNWLYTSIDVDSRNLALDGGWEYTAEVAFHGSAEWERYDFTSDVFARTPVLAIVNLAGVVTNVDQQVDLTFDGSTDVLALDADALYAPINSPWEWNLGAGVIRIDGGSDVTYVPTTVGFESNSSTARWDWDNLLLGYVEVGGSRRLTSQIRVGYWYRQYLPISGDWRRNGEPAGVPTDIDGITLGSLFQIRASMSL